MISEAPTGSQVHTVVGIDFAAFSRFNVGVEVQILRGVEVGAEAVFIPSAAKILRETPAMALERIGVARLSLPIVKDGRPDVYEGEELCETLLDDCFTKRTTDIQEAVYFRNRKAKD